MDFRRFDSSSGKKTQPKTSIRNQTFTPKSNFTLKHAKTICNNQLSEEKKQKFLLQRKGLNTFIKDNLDFEADVVFIIKNTPDSISRAKQEFKNLYVKFAKSKDVSFKIAFGLIFLDRKGEDLVISQPFKEFCKGSMENFNTFIEIKYMGLDSSEIGSSYIKNITDNEFGKILETIKKLKWVSTKSRLCLFFADTNSTEKIEEMLKNLEKLLNITFYALPPPNEDDDQNKNEVFQEETKISSTIPAMRTINNKKITVSKIISEEIQKVACATIDFKLLEEKTKKNTLFTINNSTQPNVYSNNSLKVEQFISTSPLYLELSSIKPNFNSNDFKVLDARAITFFIVRDLNIDINWSNPLIQYSNITTKVWICDSPFAEGSMRYAFYMKDVYLNEKLVGKIPKTLDSNYNVSCMRRDVEATIIFGHLVHDFNERMILKFQSEDQLLLNVANVYIYEILSPDYPYKYLWVENLLEGEYKKYNNNSGWQDPSETTYNLMAQAFSHFSWQFTKGYLMIVDLQGPYGVFTDPQIHCLDFEKFGAGNFGKLGMIRFFLTHKCNKFCKALGLIHLNPEDKTEIGEDFWEKIPDFEMFKGANEDYVRLCDLCRRPYKITKKEWFNHRSTKNKFNFKEDYCYLCFKKKEESMVEGGECQDCRKNFKYSKYWFVMKRTEKPVRCSNCRLLNREKERRELNEKKSNENC